MGKKIEFTQEQTQKIITLYNDDNLSLRKIANMFGCHYVVVRKLLDANNIAIRKPNDDVYCKISEEDKDNIVKMFHDGMKIIDIANKFDVVDSWICKILDSKGVQHTHTKIDNEQYQDIINMYESGNTIESIAISFSVSESLISLILHSCGVDIRKPKDYARTYTFNENYFDIIDTQNKAYILGLLYADGCNHYDSNTISIELQDRDVDILHKINEEIENEKPLYFCNQKKYNEKWYNTYAINLFSEHMSNVLADKGCTPRKSLTLTFPDWMRDDLMRHFIRGAFDGDGCIYYDEQRERCQAAFASSKLFCDGLSSVLRQMGMKHSIKSGKHYNDNTKSLVVCGNKSCLKFLSWLYDDAELYINRKYQKYVEFKEKYLNKITLN